MSASPAAATVPDVASPAAHRAVGYAKFTIGYNVIEGIIAISAGAVASAVSLIGFGIDSGIEVAAAVVVLVRLLAEIKGGEPDEAKERRALKFIALTFFALAAYVTVEGIRDLVGGAKPDTSLVGIVLTGLSIVIMPWLARAKRKAGLEMNSRLVVADAAETKLCAWLSVSTFAGLLAFAAFGWTWLDPVAGFVIAAFAIMEGKEAWEGELVCDDGCDDEDDGKPASAAGGSCSDGCK
ncbi:cation transporter [Streptomyces coelicoflavus]|uniref:Cation transporter n=2 Tax=Streptomyces TaxID=1883 RepID=A0A369UVB8_9ACTN|nr:MULTISPECIES: cation transporter [Streptomyces]MYS46615.1 cation transporter [Streptomyces sp. SID5998]WDI21521.1 cation transporter [Streptomyces enissocaesilis]AIV33336.1 cation transporter [Streptomyces sp. CCM_MD2014]MCT7350606.1 cation transporter [Streptomyces sp. 15-116A]MCW1097646.1 cation transporter [Streptomyces sp. RS2]